MVGTRFGPYEILAKLGEGGMGEVYRARDTRLNRTVALKLLSPEFRDRADRRQRFDLEARAISSLQHPHICALFDVGEQDGTAFLVMEHLEGETLDDRLLRGPLPAKDVLLYAEQIAGALDHAHRAHVIHRDLKPGNVMLTASGAKLLDFGLARNRGVEITASTPTITMHPERLTSEGTILGTFQYMAPEQLEGKDADARTDLFALGTVIFEMATGRKAFEGKNQASLIAAILTGHPPPVSTVRTEAALPAALDHVVDRCLAKAPDDRWQTARDVKMELQWIAGGSGASRQVAAASPRRRVSESIAWTVAAIALVLAGWTLVSNRQTPPATEEFVVPLPAGTTVGIGRDLTTLAMSPDGTLAFVAVTGGRTALWVLPQGQTMPRRLDGTDGGVSPFWSHDGRSLGFVSRDDGMLKRIDPSPTGGPARVICPVNSNSTPVWAPDDTILFSETNKGISRVSGTGGTPELITRVKREAPERELNHYWPSLLPDGRHFLYTATNLGPNGQRATPIVYVASIDPNEPRQEIAREHSRMVYTAPGQVLFVQEATLFAQSFDLTTLRPTGQPARVSLDLLNYYRSTGQAAFAVSDSGRLAYQSGTGPLELVWFDRNGDRLGTLGPSPQRVSSVRISPDDTNVMAEVLDPKLGTSDLHNFVLARGTSYKFTNDPNDEGAPVWSPDGLKILLKSDRGTGADASPDFFIKALDGSPEELFFHRRGPQTSEDWSRTGLIAFAEPSGKTGRDIWLLTAADKDKKERPFVELPDDQAEPRFSPNGDWLAYVSDDSDRYELFVKPLKEGGHLQPVSVGGGFAPRWRNDTELFYISGDGDAIMSVSTQWGPTLTLGPPKRVFTIGALTTFRTLGGNRVFDVTRDGQKFLIGVPTPDSASRITIVSNWRTATPR
jgi:Tol biopolymer transport system component